MRKPQVGDIWLRRSSKKAHYLIIGDRVWMDGIKYHFVVLETGEKDLAYIEFFNTFCEFIT